MARENLVGMAKDENGFVRVAVAGALGAALDGRARKALETLKQDPVLAVRLAAKLALSKRVN